MAMSDAITATEAATILGLADGPTARRTLSRWGVPPVGRAPGRGGETLYDRDTVIAEAREPRRRGRPAAPATETARIAIYGRMIDVPLDRLTARAAALAVSFAALPMGDSPTVAAVVLESVRPLRDLTDPAEHEHYDPAELDGPAYLTWRSWSRYKPGGQPTVDSMVAWLEREAAALPAGYVPVGPWVRHERIAPPVDPTLDDPTSDGDLLTRSQAMAELRRLGRPVDITDWHRLQRDSDLPGPVVFQAGTPRWSSTELAAWARKA